jgi:WD40 repeat protein
VAVSGVRDTWRDVARVWDLRTGESRGKPLHGSPAGIEIGALGVGKIDGVPVAVGGSRNAGGPVEVWDLATGAQRGSPISRHYDGVTALAVGDVNGIPVAVSGDKSGTISLSALDRRQRISVQLEASARVRAIAFGGEAGWVTATLDGSLFLWRPARASRSA